MPETLVLIPGLNNSSSLWQPLIAALPGDIVGQAVDLPALDDVDAIADAVVAAAPGRFVAVGHSFGGYVALAILARHPERLDGVVLINSSAEADDDRQRTARLDRIERVRPDTYVATAMSVVEASYHHDNIVPGSATGQRLIEGRRKMLHEYGFDRFVAHTRAAAARRDRTALLGSAGVPVLVVAADDDRVIPTERQRAMAHGAGADLRVLGPAGHMLPAEQPAALAAAIADWVRERDRPLPRHAVTGDGPLTVFLLHGAYGDGRYFDHTRDVLVAAEHRVVVWDCPGYAGTPSGGDGSIAARARALADLVEAVGGESNVLLGHSMGGLIAPLAATMVPDRVHALVLSHTSPGLLTRTPQEQAQFIAERIDPIADGQSIGDYAPGLLASMMGPGAGGPLVDRVVEVVCEMSTETFKSAMRAIAEYDGTPALRAVAVPTLLIAGEYDPACPPSGMRQIRDLVAGACLHELAGAGHYGFAERPDEYERVVTGFLNEVLA